MIQSRSDEEDVLGHAGDEAGPTRTGGAPDPRTVLGAGKDSLSLSTRHLVTGERSVVGSFTGSPYENEKALDFSVLAGVRPRIETVPLEKRMRPTSE